MARLIEFVGNHPILFLALALVIGMIAFFEYQRAFSGVKIISPMEATRLQNDAVSYTHLRAHETGRNLVCRLLLEKKNRG